MIDYKKIEEANKTIKTTAIKRQDKTTGETISKDYAEVNQRIKAFRMVYPNGSITTEIVTMDNGVVTMMSTVKNEEGTIIGTGFAQEKENSTFINKTSYIENCETSAVGRALGMCGFGIETSVASAEEVENAINNQQKEEVKEEKPKITTEQLEEIRKQEEKLQTWLLHKFNKKSLEELNTEEAAWFIKKLKDKKEKK